MQNQPDVCKTHFLAIEAFCRKDKVSLCAECVAIHSKKAHKIFHFPKFVIERYREFAFLGKGGFGIVFKAENQFSGTIKAIKILKISKEDKNTKLKLNIENIKKEVNILSEMKHENIVQLNEVFLDEMENHLNVIIIMEYCEIGLKSYLKNKLTDFEQHSILLQIALGVQDMHKKGVIHCDLKPDNIFMKYDKTKKKYEVKIGDFGISILMDSKTQSQKYKGLAGTKLFISPEVWNDEYFGRKTDVWACGVIFYDILFGLHPYQKENEKMDTNIIADRIEKKEKLELTKHLYSSPYRKYRRLIENCLHLNKEKRFSSDEMVEELHKISFNFYGEGEEEKIMEIVSKEAAKRNENSQRDPQKKNSSQKSKKIDRRGDLSQPLITKSKANTKTSKSKENTKTSNESRGIMRIEKNVENEILDLNKTIIFQQLVFDDSESARPRLNQISKQSFSDQLNNRRQQSEWSSIRYFELKMEQSTYNSEFIDEICKAIEELESVESLELSLNNKIVYVENSPGDCLCFYSLAVLTFGLILALGKKNPCSCSGFYCHFNEAIDYRNAGKGVITDKELKKICRSIGNLQNLRTLKLDLRYNAITSHGLLTSVGLLNEGVKQMDVELKLQNQMTNLDYGEIQDLKDKELFKLGNFRIDL